MECGNKFDFLQYTNSLEKLTIVSTIAEVLLLLYEKFDVSGATTSLGDMLLVEMKGTLGEDQPKPPAVVGTLIVRAFEKEALKFEDNGSYRY